MFLASASRSGALCVLFTDPWENSPTPETRWAAGGHIFASRKNEDTAAAGHGSTEAIPLRQPPGSPQVTLLLGTGRRCEPDLASGPEPRRCLVAISCQLERCWRGFLGWRVLTADPSSPSSISWRIASERDRASSQAFIHSSMRPMSSCNQKLRPCRPEGGNHNRPMGLFIRVHLEIARAKISVPPPGANAVYE
jgi:hypothetical protein